MQLTLAQGYSLTTMLAVAVGAILLTGAFYYRAFGAIGRRRWQLLLALRIVAILLIIVLLFRPVFSYQNELTEKPSVLMLLDTSASMSMADDETGVTRFDQARNKLQKWSQRLKDDFLLLPVVFAEQAVQLDGPDSLAGLAADGKATSLVRALGIIGKIAKPADIAAVFLLSDGIHNSAGSPLETAGRLGLPVHCIGVGASLRSNISYRDVQVTGMDCPDRMILNNTARITASIDAVGLGGRVVQAFLDEDQQQIGQTELTLDDAEGSQQVVFEFRPMQKGRHTYTVRVPPVAEEKITENNQRSTVSTVIEPGIRVLYIEGTLRPEYGAIVDRFLAKDPDLEFCALVQTQPNVFLKRSNISDLKFTAIPTDQETIDRFDVFIFGDIDSSYIRPAQQEMFVKRVREGGGLVMLGGYHSLGPGGYTGSPLGEALPVMLGDRQIGQLTESFLPQLTPEGARHPIFANIADFFPTPQGPPKVLGLPDLDGCTRVAAARPGATVLATGPDNMPVLAVQPLDRGRTAVFVGDTTRKWQQVLRAMDQESPFLRFWGQMIRWLAGRGESVEAKAGVTAATDKAYYEPGEPMRISAIVRDQEGQGAKNARIVADIRTPAGKTEKVALAIVPGPGGHYGGVFEPQTAGAYEVTIEAQLDELSLKADKIPVEVGRPNLEFEKLDFDEKLMTRIAAETGGRYVHISTADHLIDQIDRRQRKKTERIEWPLFWPPGFWALFVAVLTTEWILRKKYQLR